MYKQTFSALPQRIFSSPKLRIIAEFRSAPTLFSEARRNDPTYLKSSRKEISRAAAAFLRSLLLFLFAKIISHDSEESAEREMRGNGHLPNCSLTWLLLLVRRYFVKSLPRSLMMSKDSKSRGRNTLNWTSFLFLSQV